MRKLIYVLCITFIFYGTMFLAMDIQRSYIGLEAISYDNSFIWYSPLIPKNIIQVILWVIYAFGIAIVLSKKNKAVLYEPSSYEWVQAFKAKKP